MDRAIDILLIALIIFTPVAFGSQPIWAFSLMELGILLIITLWAIKGFSCQRSSISSASNHQPTIKDPHTTDLVPRSSIRLPILLLSLFLGIVLIQIVPLPHEVIKVVSPKTYEFRNQLTDHGLRAATLSLFPLATKIEFFKWVALVGLFAFLLRWNLSDNGYRAHRLIIATIMVAVFESLYGIFEFFSGHHHILNLDWSARMSSVTGTFVNRNYFAGYLLMVIPLTIGFLFSREASQPGRNMDWRHRLSSMDGRTFLMWFGLVLMILGLLLSASRAGILSLLLSFSLLILLFRDSQRRRMINRIPIMILGLALLWAAWIGMDAVVSRFFTVSEGLGERWVMWGNTIGIFKDFPLLGSGLGTFTEIFPMYRSFHASGLFTHAENDFLQLGSEVGLLGFGSLLVLFSFLGYRAVTGLRRLPHGEPRRYIGIGGLVGILALMLHSTMERNIQVPANAFLYTVMWAMVLGIALDPSSDRFAPKEQESKE